MRGTYEVDDGGLDRVEDDVDRCVRAGGGPYYWIVLVVKQAVEQSTFLQRPSLGVRRGVLDDVSECRCSHWATMNTVDNVFLFRPN